MKPMMSDDVAAAFVEVLDELASEIDLNFDKGELAAAGPTVKKIEDAAKLVEACGYKVTETVTHILNRYKLDFN